MHQILDHNSMSAGATAHSGVDFLSVYRELPVPVGLLDKKFRFIDFNNAFGDLLGYSLAELIGQQSLFIVAPESVEDVRQTRNDFISGRIQRATFNRIIKTRSGRRLACVIEIKAMPAVSTECRYLVVYHDVDEVRQRERLLIDRTELFRVAVDQSPVPLTLQDSDFRLVMVNKAYCEMSGYTAEELIGRDPIDLHEAGSQDVLRKLRAQLSDSGQYNNELKRVLVHRNGQRIPYQIVMRHTVAVDGSQLYCSVLQDLSNIEMVRTQVAEQRNWFFRAFDNAPSGILYTVPGQDVVHANKALIRMIGTEDPAVLRRLVPRDAAQCTEQGREFDGGRIALRRPGQESQWLERISSIVQHFDGTVRTVTVFTDVTREQQLRADLQSAVAQQAALLHTMDTGLVHVVGDLIVRVNPALLQLSGKSEEALLGQPIEALFERAGQWEAICGDGNGKMPVQPNSCIVELSRAGDNPLRCEVSVRQVDPMRTDLGLLLTVKDISEWLNQNDELSRSLNDLENLIDTEPLGIAQVERGQLIRVNKAMRRLLEIPAKDLLRTSFADVCVNPAEVRQYIDRCAQGLDQDKLLRTTLIGRNGLQSDCVLHGARIGDSQRDAVMVMVLDLSNQARVASLALKMQGRFEAFSSLLNDAMVVIENPSGQILHANEAVADVLGVQGHGIAGTNVDRLWTHISSAEAESVQNAFADLQVGRVASLAVTVMHPMAGELHVRLRMFIAQDGRESFVLAEDMTQSLALEKKRLADAVKQKDGLVREVHHRIKNNLQGVAGLLQQSAVREPKLTGILGEVAGQIHAVAQVHGLQLQDQKLTPQGIVRAIADNIRHTFGHNVPLRIVERDDRQNSSNWIVPEQEAVPLALVINEIASNALKHGEQDCEVTIHVTPSDSGFQVVVSNKGQLPDDFDLATRPVSPSGLGLIRALMPKRGAELTLEAADNGLVVARLLLEAPALMLDLPAARISPRLPDRHV